MVSEDSTCTVLLHARCLLMLLLRAADSKERRCAVCGITFKITCNMERKQERFCANQNTKESRRIQNTPTSKNIILFIETPYMDLRAGHTKGDTSDIAIVQPAEPPRTSPRDRGCQNTCLYIPLAYVCRSALSREHWRMALSKLEKLCWKGRRGSDRLGP